MNTNHETKHTKRTPVEWKNIDNVLIVNPDGWRNEDRDWNEPITRKEWERLSKQSTQMRTEREKA